MAFEIRKAEQHESQFLGQVTLAALNLYDFTPPDAKMTKMLAVATSLCATGESLYSYRHALIATTGGGRPAGAIISYDGADYAALRQKSFTFIKEETGIDNFSSAMETGPGEFYLDSLAVVPEFRGRKLGQELILAAIAAGRRRGFKRFSLIVDINHPRVRDYYMAIGFVPETEMQAFQGIFTKMGLDF